MEQVTSKKYLLSYNTNQHALFLQSCAGFIQSFTRDKERKRPGLLRQLLLGKGEGGSRTVPLFLVLVLLLLLPTPHLLLLHSPCLGCVNRCVCDVSAPWGVDCYIVLGFHPICPIISNVLSTAPAEATQQVCASVSMFPFDADQYFILFGAVCAKTFEDSSQRQEETTAIRNSNNLAKE